MHQQHRPPLNVQKSIFTAERIFILLLNIFVTFLVSANLIAAKYISFGGLRLSAATVVYPLAFILITIVAELYGAKLAKTAIFIGVVVNIFTHSLIWLVNYLPIDANSLIDQASFNQTVGFFSGISISLLVAYIMTQYIDLQIFTYLCHQFPYKPLWFKNSIAKLISQLLDSIMVVTITWVVWPKITGTQQIKDVNFATWHLMVTEQYICKTVYALLATPGLYATVYFIRPRLKFSAV